MQQIIQSSWRSEASPAQRGEEPQVCTMQQNIQLIHHSKELSADTQWGKDTHMFRLQQIIQSSWRSEDSPADTQWGKD